MSSETGISCSRHTEADKTRNQVTHTHTICPKLSRSESLCLPHKSPAASTALGHASSASKHHLKDAKDSLGCTPQACKRCTRPASSWKKEPGVSNRGLRGLMDGGILHTEARPWRDTSPAVLTSGKGSRLPVTELTSDQFVGRQGNLQRPTPCTAPLINHLGGAVLMERLQQAPAGPGSQYVGLPP